MLDLTPFDFNILKTPKGDVIEYKSSKDLTVIIFYKNDENKVYSDQYIKIFKEIEQTEMECTFAGINVDEYPNQLELSTNTKTPIHYVPYVVIYVQGRPYMSYSGKIDPVEIIKLITYVQLMQTVTASMQFDPKSIIPIYMVT